MRELLARAWRENAGVRFAVGWNLVLLAIAVVALPFDHRLILGLNPWIKPMKFDVSVIIFLMTVGLLLSGIARWARLRGFVGWGVGVSMIVEDTIIELQSLRGVRSHMNYATPRDALLFAVMGLFIALSTALVAVLLGMYLVDRTTWTRPVVWGFRLGLAALLAGSSEGVLMVAKYQAHTIGAKDGGPGLPFVNWSTGHGDLRVAHFFALHALQVFPLLGWLVGKLPVRDWVRVGLVFVGSAGYMAVVWWLFREAVSGRSLLG